MEIAQDSRIKRVVVHARGAWVTRAIEDFDASADEVDVVLRGITPHAEPGSFRAVVAQPRGILSVRAALEAPDAAPLAGPTVRRVDALNQELERLGRERAMLEARSQLLAESAVDPGLAARAKQELVRDRTLDALAAARVLDRLAVRTDTRLAELDARIRRLGLERDAAILEDAQTSSAERMGEAHPRRKIVARLGGGGAVRGLEITYAIRAARWWPLYTLRMLRDAPAAWWMEALIAQESGEDWSNVELSLSTADMIFDARLPELPSLRLGKARPRLRGSYRAPPAGLDLMFSAYDRAFVAAELTRHTTLGMKTAGPKDGAARDEPMMELRRAAPMKKPMPQPAPAPAEITEEAELASVMPDSAPMAPPAAKAAVAPQSMRSRAGAVPFTSMPSFGGGGDYAKEAPPPPPEPPPPPSPTDEWLDFDRLRLGRVTDIRVRGRLYVETDISIRVVEDAEGRIEGVDAGQRVKDPRESRGNFDHRYEAKGRAEVPSDGLPHRMQVAMAEARPRFVLTTVPREAADVYREADLENPFDAPLLEGPVDVYLDGTFLTNAWIESIDRGGRLRVGMGVEERVRIARNARFHEDVAGLLGGTTEVTHEIGIELSSSLAEPVSVEVRDRIPVSDDKTLEVKLLSESTKSTPLKQAESDEPLRGGLRWSVRLDPRGQGRVDYSYKMSFPSKNEIVGGNRREQ